MKYSLSGLLACLLLTLFLPAQASSFEQGKADTHSLLNQFQPRQLIQGEAAQNIQSLSASPEQQQEMSSLRHQGGNLEDTARERLHESEAGFNLLSGLNRPKCQDHPGLMPPDCREDFREEADDRMNQPSQYSIQSQLGDVRGSMILTEYDDCQLEEVELVAQGQVTAAETCMAWPVISKEPCDRVYQAQCDCHWVDRKTEDLPPERVCHCSGEWVFTGSCATGYCRVDGLGELHKEMQDPDQEETEPVPEDDPGEDCVEGPETRMINDYPVYQACWRRRGVYDCVLGQTEEEPQCQVHRQNSCIQTGVQCMDTLDGNCVAWEQQYRCPTNPAVTQEVMNCQGSRFCFNQDCVDTGYESSTDIAQATAYLNMMSEMGKDMQLDPLQVFAGDRLQCTDYRYLNCCSKPSGRRPPGRDPALKEIRDRVMDKLDDLMCDAEAEELRERRRYTQCVRVGRRCAKRVLRVCVRYVESFCCFSGKLGRILQEQGRAQLGLSFGTANNPNCRGLTPEELERIDWSQLDLSEFFEDALQMVNPASNQDLEEEMRQRTQRYFQ